jgi:hypothetical protein
MMKEIPPRLYKYGSLQNPDYLREVLLGSKIYCCSPLDFNDPFDCRPKIIVGKTRQEVEAAKKEIEGILLKRTSLNRNSRRVEARRIVKQIQEAIGLTHEYNLLLGRTGVYCLSAKNDNLLMWAHYGDSHMGYCLEFSTESYYSIFSKAEPVRYQKQYPIVKLFTADKVEWGKESLLTKSTDWKYEDEWRLTSAKPGHLDFPPEKLISVIFGCKISETNRNKILEWNITKNPPVILRQAIMHEDEFGIHIRDL